MTLVENDKVLLKKDNCYRIVNIVNKTIDLDRTKFSLNGLIGHSFGSTFTVENGNLIKIVDKMKFEQYGKLKVENLISEESSESTDVNVTRDNRNMNVNGKNQLMSANDISELKKNGETGDAIMSKLIENSTSFAQKTTFAQEKYLNKKKKRYLPVISVHRITTRMLCELYAAKNKLKIMNLRIDTVSQILAYSNAHHGSRVLLSETCAGLILGSLIEKGAQIINFYHGSAPVIPDCYSEWRELDNRVFNLPLGQMIPLATTGKFVNHFNAESKEKMEEADIKLDKKRAYRSDGESAEKRVRLSPEVVLAKREERDRRREEARSFLMSGLHDSLIIAIKFHPVEVTLQMLHFLAPGKPFVVYSQFLQPLVELYDELRKKSSTCSLKISESWLRNYQILADRTHPEMSMSGTGGYLLTGMKLLDSRLSSQ